MLQKLTIQRTAIIVLFMLLLAMAARIPLDTDMYWHLGSARHIVEEGGLFYGDPFSHTMPGAYRVNFDWGGQLVMYGLWQIGGLTAMMLFTTITAILGMYWVYRAMPDNPYLNALILVLATAAAAAFWSPRPQMMTHLFTCFTVFLVYRYKWQGIDRLWWFVPMMLLWGNMHAGYIVGFIILGGMIAGEIANMLIQPDKVTHVGWSGVRKMIVVGIAGAAVLVINPYGLDLYTVPFNTFGLQVLRDYIQEWQPPVLTQSIVLPYTTMLILTPLAMVLSRRRLDFSELVLLLGTGYLSITVARNIALFAVVAAPILSRHLNDFMQNRGWVVDAVQRPTRTMVRLNIVIIILVALGVLLNIVNNALPKVQQEALASALPVDAVAYLQSHALEGEMFNSYNWGGYLIYYLPDSPVFIDGRTDLYGNFVDDFAQVTQGRTAPDAMFEEYNVGYVLIENGGILDEILRSKSGWDLLYEDDVAVIYVKAEV